MLPSTTAPSPRLTAPKGARSQNPRDPDGPGGTAPEAAQLLLQGANDALEDRGIWSALGREGQRVVNPEDQNPGISEAKDPPGALADPESMKRTVPHTSRAQGRKS